MFDPYIIIITLELFVPSILIEGQANSVESDQMHQNAATDQGRRRLHVRIYFNKINTKYTRHSLNEKCNYPICLDRSVHDA